MSDPKIENCLYLARICHLSGDHDLSIKYLTELIKLKKGKISEEERHLLFTSFKSLINFRREAWRTVDAIEMKEKLNKSKYLPKIQELKKNLCNEISDYISQALNLIEKYLLKNANNDEVSLTYAKIRGDYERYLLEITPKEETDKINEIKKKAAQFYLTGYEICDRVNNLSCGKIGFILNYTVFLFENLNEKKIALQVADETYKRTLKAINDDNYDLTLMKDLNKLLELLKQNIEKWEIMVKEIEEKEAKVKKDEDNGVNDEGNKEEENGKKGNEKVKGGMGEREIEGEKIESKEEVKNEKEEIKEKEEA